MQTHCIDNLFLVLQPNVRIRTVRANRNRPSSRTIRWPLPSFPFGFEKCKTLLIYKSFIFRFFQIAFHCQKLSISITRQCRQHHSITSYDHHIHSHGFTRGAIKCTLLATLPTHQRLRLSASISRLMPSRCNNFNGKSGEKLLPSIRKRTLIFQSFPQ